MKEFVEKLISRLKKLTNGELCESVSNEVCKKYKNCRECYKNLATEFVNELTEDWNNGWIPCGERLPDRDLWCWATFESGNVDKIQYLASQKWWNGEMADNRVIAWKKIAPYQPKGE